MRAGILIGVYTVLLTELLSLFDAVTRLGLSLGWGLPLLVLVWDLRLRAKIGWKRLFPPLSIPESWSDRIFFFAVFFILILTAIVAWYSPPNTWDSLTTHMSRVAHWAQQRSIHHYATGTELQNFYPPLPAMAILQTYILAGGDWLANFSQWTAMVLTLIGVSLIAKDFRATSSGQLLAVVFVASLPMGIAQATSTMTDYIVAVLMVSAVSEIRTLQLKSGSTPIFFLSMSAGLGILSKPYAVAYLTPLAILSVIVLLRQHSIKYLLKCTAIAIGIVFMINLGYFGRNLNLYGNPISSQERFSIHSNDVTGWRLLVSNTLRNASLHAGSSSSTLNQWIYDNLYKVHVKLGLELADSRTSIHPRFHISPPSVDEALASNPYHAVLILLCMPLLILQGNKANWWIWIYTLTFIATFLLLSYLFKFSIFGSRYHTTFFALMGPVIGFTFSSFSPRTVNLALGAMLVVSSWPWLTSIQSRPLIPDPSLTSSRSVLVEDRDVLYLGDNPLFESYEYVSTQIQKRGCSRVYLMLSSSQPEYVLWAYLGKHREVVQIEWNVTDTPSAQLADHDFDACAVICDATCDPSWERIRGLPLEYEDPILRLYLIEKNN